jgi:hypothetical protein
LKSSYRCLDLFEARKTHFFGFLTLCGDFRTPEFTKYVCEILKTIFSAEDNVWMQGCSRSISAAAPVSSRVLSEIPFVNITQREFSAPIFGHTDSSLLRVRDWAYLGLRIPPAAFFHPDAMRKAMVSTPFEASPASKTVADRRRAWNVPNLELDSPLLRSWKIQADAKAINFKYVEHAHIRSAVSEEWFVAKPPSMPSVDSTLAAAAPHKELELDADSHISITSECGKRRLEGDGSHRTLSTTVQLASKTSLAGCKVIVAELFDQGIFIDHYEVENMYRYGALPNWATVFTAIDLEKPAYESTQNFVFVHSRVDERNVVNVSLPIHFRYQAPSWSTIHEPVQVVSLEIYVQCVDDQPWVHVTHWGSSGHDTCPVVTAYIPIGDLSIESYIKWGTLAFTALGAFALVAYATDCFSPLSDPDQSKDKKRDKPKDD